jgi:ribosomal protein S18 acetylase RimI-like enzyme
LSSPFALLFALLLLVALGLAAAVAFVGLRFRRRLRWALRVSLLFVWAGLFASLWQIGVRTSLALVAPGSARQPHVIKSALAELFSLLLSFGGPAALVTFLCLWALRATRPDADAPERRRKKRRPSRLLSVRGPGKELDETRRLFEEYARALDFELGSPLAGFQDEIRELPGVYAPPRGRLILARVRGQPAGCIGVRDLGDGIAEMKRLYVRPDFRHAGLGRALAEAALEAAGELGCGRVRLDTLPAMREATGLYRSLGFLERGPFGDPPTPGAIFLERELRARKRG